jgi:hypothetical protein
MANDPSEEAKNQAALAKIAADREVQRTRTSDQPRPQPPQNAKSLENPAPSGAMGTRQTALSEEKLRHNAELTRQAAERKARIEALRNPGGLKKEFDHYR